MLRFSLLVAFLLFFYYFITSKPPEKIIEEPYWSVSQFETSFWRLKADLARMEDGGKTWLGEMEGMWRCEDEKAVHTRAFAISMSLPVVDGH